MFGSIKEKLGLSKKTGEVLIAPLQGKAVPVTEVSDPTFGQEILGKGVAIVPSEGRVVAPVDGTIEMIFETKHAVSMTSDSGIQILIHVGLDTVKLNGSPFKAYAENGQHVKRGDLLLEFDIEAIKAAGLESITPIVICNSGDYKEIKTHVGKAVEIGDDILTLIK